MSLKILFGAHIRYSALVAAAEATNWEAGRVMTLDADGKLALNTTGTTNVVGLAVEKRVPSTQYSVTASSQKAAPSGEKYSIVLDESVVEDNQISGNTAFSVGGAIYVDDGGRLTDQNARNRIIGKCLSPHTVGSAVKMLFTVQY